jgi:hypothetical protein
MIYPPRDQICALTAVTSYLKNGERFDPRVATEGASASLIEINVILIA